MTKSASNSKSPATPRPVTNPNYPSTTDEKSGKKRGNVPKNK